jgi:hypothetical protein
MWIDPDDDRFQNWERKSPKERVETWAKKVAEHEFDSAPIRSSLYLRLVQSLGHDATKQNSLPTTDEAERVFEPIENFVGDLYHTVTNYTDEENPNFWRHQDNILEDARREKAPPIRREDAEGLADAYLRLPYRSSVADRTLTDMLVAGELFAFSREVFNQRKTQRFFGGGPLPLFVGRGCTLLFTALLGGFAYVLQWLGVISVNVFVIVLMVLGALFLLEAAWALFHFPFAWRAQSKHNTRTAQLLLDMNGVYCELSSTGPISARHVRERAQAVSAAGAVWPAPLFVMLEDVIERGGRM